jgi:two-component system, NtrC family, sensor kinase
MATTMEAMSGIRPTAVSTSGTTRGDDRPLALIIDDSLTIRMDLAAAFEAAGFVVRLCGTAAEARAAWADRVSVVVLDVLLPDGDGIDLLGELRANPATARVPILMLSIEADVEDRIRGMRTGADDYVGKPYDTPYVIARAKELLRAGEDASPQQPAVLVIDDSPTFRDQLRHGLEQCGYLVLAAASGEDGLRLAAMHRPTALIVDGQMPGMDGPTVIRRIRLDTALRSIPCILLTGSDAHGDELRALDAGADAFARKSRDLELVLARLAAVLRRDVGTPNKVAPLLSPKRVLVMDDSETDLQTIAGVLRSEGYDVVMARSAQPALEILAAQSVDCILLDRMIPEPGAIETCRRIKASSVLGHVPLIMISATDDRSATIEDLAAGADDCIVKSGDLELLKARVHAQIRRKQLEDDNRHRREEVLRRELEAVAAQAARKEAEAKTALAHELEVQNQELEAFAYSVSHDLRSPLRSVDAFSLATLEEHADALGVSGRGYLEQVRAGVRRMAQLIEDLMMLSRISRTEIRRQHVDLSEVARTIAADLARTAPDRKVAVDIRSDLVADVDAGLARILIENLLDNAWKFTARRSDARIEIGTTTHAGELAYFVHDNGAGFDRASAEKLFKPFTRLHTEQEFAGTGIGLATVHRIVERHGGRAWAEGAVDIGATIFFTLPAGSSTR